MPIFGTVSSQFNDGGVNQLFHRLGNQLHEKGFKHDSLKEELLTSRRYVILPPDQQNYLAEVVKATRDYSKETTTIAEKASQWGALEHTREILKGYDLGPELWFQKIQTLKKDMFLHEWSEKLSHWDQLVGEYKKDELVYKVRDQRNSNQT